ncbi:MAG TPA: intein-containing Rv2578c family radical SAM protein [Streptosporangiaceae bacterium]|nr:intein-containing Rv2578c family radical SAM protein [Streptosporangiaceae bacterium]
MRWDNLRLTPDRANSADGRPPALFELAAVTRTFDTPDFRGMTFHEVHAKSIISKVPAASRVPFHWTINPYRGCGHGCVYCVWGETPVLMADGRTKPIAQLHAGDALYGTVRQGNYRRYVPTTVLAHWQTVKPAWRVTLEDGTGLVCSEDHRFLTGRGWKHVTGAEQGSARRPHLTLNSELLGVGRFAEPPKESADYRRGYLCGMIRGDGNIQTGSYQRRTGGCYDLRQFRLALVDSEALDRTSRYLAQVGIATTEFTFAQASETRQRVRAIRTATRDQVCAIQWLIEWPVAPSLDWRKGFLAGVFDAEGSCSRGILRITNTDPAILSWTMSCLASLQFDVAVDRTSRPNGLTHVRLRGGLKERLRFFHAVDPAITRKRTIDGVAIKSDARLKVMSIEPLGLDVPMYDITTGTGDFIADGVVSHNCFARNTHTYLDFDSGHDFDTQIVVKVNAVERLRQELAAPRWQGEHIAMGTNVDCYQRAEGRYQLMPGIISALTQAANPFSILTKGTLVLRDIELLAAAAEVTDVGLNVSAGIVDKELSRLIEPGTPAPDRRLAACAALNERGLPCGVLMGPVLPFLTDSPSQLDRAVREIAVTGATHVSPIVLHLRTGAREWFEAWLRECYPDLVAAYAQLYRGRAYAPASYQAAISAQVAELARKYGVGKASPARARRVQAGKPDASAAEIGAASGALRDTQLTLL